MGGAERLMLDILSRLNRRKFSVEIVTVVGAGPLEADFRGLGYPIYSVGPAIEEGKRLFSKVRWVILAPLTLWRLVALMRKIKPDVVLTSLYQADILGIWAAKASGVKDRIIIQHDVIPLSYARRIFKKYAIKLSTKVITVSRAVQTFMVSEWSVPERKIKVVYGGVDFGKFRGQRALNRNLVVGVVGRLEKVKGPDIFVKAALELKKTHHMEPEILMVGGGSARSPLGKLIGKELSKIKFVGSVSNAHDWLKKIDVLVVPSRSEGFGLVLIEGLLSKCLVVASDIPAFREIVDGQNGLLFPMGDHKRLAAILAQLLTNHKEQATLRKGTDNWIKNDSRAFNIETTVSAYEALFNSEPSVP